MGSHWAGQLSVARQTPEGEGYSKDPDIQDVKSHLHLDGTFRGFHIWSVCNSSTLAAIQRGEAVERIPCDSTLQSRLQGLSLVVSGVPRDVCMLM